MFLLSASNLERIFATTAPAFLPVAEAELSRSESGRLEYRWPSPCEALGSLWASILDGEIMLYSKIFHSHFDRHAYEVRSQNPTEQEIPELIVQSAINEIAAIFRGERTFTISYNADGSARSSGMTPRRLRNSGAFLDPDPSRCRYWDWEGEFR